MNQILLWIFVRAPSARVTGPGVREAGPPAVPIARLKKYNSIRIFNKIIINFAPIKSKNQIQIFREN